MTELDEVERPSTPRAPGGPAPNPTATPPTAGASKLSSTDTAKTTDQSTAAGANQAAQGAPGVSNKQSPAASGTKANQEQQAKAESAIDSPDELHDPDTTTADFVSVRVHTRSRSQRSRRQQTQQQNPRETPDNLAATSAEDKAALETCGRHFAAKRLESLGYKVTPMSQGNPGFDLKGEKPGDTIEVEVKAHAGESSSVFITQREWEENLKVRGAGGVAWELWNVENLAKASGKKPTIQRIRYIPKSAMKESGYWIDLNQCS